MAPTILIVEDDPGERELALIALAADGPVHESVLAEDGQKALDYLFGAKAAPAVVLLDLNLPKMPGLEVLRRIRADSRTKRQPVVVLTSSDAERDRLAAYELGANSYVRKPADFDEFRSAVKSLKHYWLAVNGPPPWPTTP